MSGLEIERKFLVKKGGAYRRAAFSSSRIVQGYIPCDNATVRIRLRQQDPITQHPSPITHHPTPNTDQAFLTIKGKSIDGGLSRYEFEKEITTDEARQLLKLCRGGVIDKRRYLVRSGEHVFEVDEFYGDNEGLVMAEVELQCEDQPYEKPYFFFF